jgi:hypothetical protein
VDPQALVENSSNIPTALFSPLNQNNLSAVDFDAKLELAEDLLEKKIISSLPKESKTKKNISKEEKSSLQTNDGLGWRTDAISNTWLTEAGDNSGVSLAAAYVGGEGEIFASQRYEI